MASLNFNVPFSAFQSTTFINCFTSVYLYLQGRGEANVTTPCSQWESGSCNSCGNCSTKPHALQEQFFFLFDTLCGRSSLRCRYDGSFSEAAKLISEQDLDDGCAKNNIDFLFGFAGLAYHKTDDAAAFKKEIAASIEQNRPVIARLKGNAVPFAVIIGLDGDRPLCPDFRCAQKAPDPAVSLDGIERLYLIDGETAPKYTLIDGLKRIEQIMAEASAEGRWDEYMAKIGTYGPDSLGSDSPEGRAARMKRLADTMWVTFNSHNFAELFRSCLPERGSGSVYHNIGSVGRLAEHPDILFTISRSYGYTHDLAWSIIGLEKCLRWDDWSSHYYGDMLELIIRQIKENDETVLDCIRQLIKLL